MRYFIGFCYVVGKGEGRGEKISFHLVAIQHLRNTYSFPSPESKVFADIRYKFLVYLARSEENIL